MTPSLASNQYREHCATCSVCRDNDEEFSRCPEGARLLFARAEEAVLEPFDPTAEETSPQ